MIREKVPYVIYDGKKYRNAYYFNGFHGSVTKKSLRHFYLVRFNKSKKTVELSGGFGSFIAYLDPRECLKRGIEGQKKYIAKEIEKLKRTELLLKKTKGR